MRKAVPLTASMPVSEARLPAQMLFSLLVGFAIGVMLLSPRQFKPFFVGQEPAIDMATVGTAGAFPRTAPLWLGSRQERLLGPRSSTIAQAAKVLGTIKINVQAGKANPSPPIGPILGSRGLNIMAFCKEYNAMTKDKKGVVPVEITYYEDKSISLTLKTPPTSKLIMKAAGIDKGASKPSIVTPVATISKDDLKAIAETKLPDLNTRDIESAMRTIKGTCRGMGVKVE